MQYERNDNVLSIKFYTPYVSSTYKAIKCSEKHDYDVLIIFFFTCSFQFTFLSDCFQRIQDERQWGK